MMDASSSGSSTQGAAPDAASSSSKNEPSGSRTQNRLFELEAVDELPRKPSVSFRNVMRSDSFSVGESATTTTVGGDTPSPAVSATRETASVTRLDSELRELLMCLEMISTDLMVNASRLDELKSTAESALVGGAQPDCIQVLDALEGITAVASRLKIASYGVQRLAKYSMDTAATISDQYSNIGDSLNATLTTLNRGTSVGDRCDSSSGSATPVENRTLTAVFDSSKFRHTAAAASGARSLRAPSVAEGPKTAASSTTDVAVMLQQQFQDALITRPAPSRPVMVSQSVETDPCVVITVAEASRLLAGGGAAPAFAAHRPAPMTASVHASPIANSYDGLSNASSSPGQFEPRLHPVAAPPFMSDAMKSPPREPHSSPSFADSIAARTRAIVSMRSNLAAGVAAPLGPTGPFRVDRDMSEDTASIGSAFSPSRQPVVGRAPPDTGYRNEEPAPRQVGSPSGQSVAVHSSSTAADVSPAKTPMPTAATTEFNVANAQLKMLLTQMNMRVAKFSELRRDY